MQPYVLNRVIADGTSLSQNTLRFEIPALGPSAACFEYTGRVRWQAAEVGVSPRVEVGEKRLRDWRNILDFLGVGIARTGGVRRGNS